MSGAFTHLLCAGCWKRREPDRRPVRLANAPESVCCGCGAMTRSGIYFREHPEKMACRGQGPEHVPSVPDTDPVLPEEPS